MQANLRFLSLLNRKRGDEQHAEEQSNQSAFHRCCETKIVQQASQNRCQSKVIAHNLKVYSRPTQAASQFMANQEDDLHAQNTFKKMSH